MMHQLLYNEFTPAQNIKLILISLNNKLVSIDINKNKVENLAQKLNFEIKKDTDSNQEAIKQLNQYFDGERKYFELETDFLSGTDFQKQIWRELMNIPYGKTASYKELAEKVNNPSGFRAVGNANGKNPIPIIFPCHRVIHANGGLGGYSCGLEVKKLLLDIEAKN